MTPLIHAVVALAAFAAPALAWAQEDPAPPTLQQEPPSKPGSWRERYEMQEAETELMPFMAFRGGPWFSSNFEFESITASGPRSVSGNTLWNLGVDVGAVFDRRWVLYGSFDSGLSSDVTMSVLGGNAGFLLPFDSLGLLGSLPITMCISGGALIGDVNIRNFENFEIGIGGRVGIELIWRISDQVMVMGYADARYIAFDVEDQVFAKDEEYGGGSLGIGIGFIIRI